MGLAPEKGQYKLLLRWGEVAREGTEYHLARGDGFGQIAVMEHENSIVLRHVFEELGIQLFLVSKEKILKDSRCAEDALSTAVNIVVFGLMATLTIFVAVVDHESTADFQIKVVEAVSATKVRAGRIAECTDTISIRVLR